MREPEALAGVRVLDLSRLVAGNVLTQFFADFGADVVKVEQPGIGDPLRTWRTGGLDLWWRVYARNKRSITLDLRHPAARPLLGRLVERSAVVVESFIPGTLERWGIGPEFLFARNPALVLVRISGWGQEGPYRDRPGLGTLVEAMSGVAAMTGFPDRPPTLPPFPLADMVAALLGAAATVMALRHAERTGKGQVVDLSLLEPLASVLGPVAAEYRLTGRLRERIGNRSHNAAPRNTYRTRDGQWIAVSGSTPSTATRFFQAIGRPDLLEDPRFGTNEARVQNVEALDRILSEVIAERTLAEWMDRFEAYGVTAAPVYTTAQFLEDPHVRARGAVVEVPDPELGAVPMPAPVPRLSATPGQIRHPGPGLGAHNEAVYVDELGLSRGELERLRAEGVI
jgi:crotonobetainyl-CoA:carnitine CoA-transferase CaiB-like acyl-CoA transferase